MTAARGLAALALLLNALAWGISWWPFRQLRDLGVHPLWATALIYLLACVGLLAWRPLAWRGFGRHPGLWALMLAAGLANIGFNWAVTVGDVVRVVLLFYLMPAWSVLLAWPLLGEKPTAAALFRLLLALTGVVVVLKTPESPWPWPHTLVDALALMGGLCFAWTNVMLRRLHQAPAPTCILAMFTGGAVMAGLAALLGEQQGLVTALPPLAPAWLGWVGAMGLIFLVGNLGLQYGAARLSAHATAIIMLSEVVFASGSAVALGAATLNWRTVLGGCLILVASLLATVSFRK